MPSDNGDDNDPEIDGAVLWNEYVRGIKPLNKKKFLKKHVLLNADDGQIAPNNTPLQKNAEVTEIAFNGNLKPLPLYEKNKSSSQLDRATADKLRKGQIPIDARIDLHGLYQIQARDALLGFVENAYHRNLRCLLVVTGKGRLILDDHKHAHDHAPGVIKRNFKGWLAQEPYASMILKIQSAQIKDGGAGAYYILLRKKR